MILMYTFLVESRSCSNFSLRLDNFVCLIILLTVFPFNAHNKKKQTFFFDPDFGLHSVSRCSCAGIKSTSQACVPLITCPEAAPLINALLQRSAACVEAELSEDFLGALSTAYSRY